MAVNNSSGPGSRCERAGAERQQQVGERCLAGLMHVRAEGEEVRRRRRGGPTCWAAAGCVAASRHANRAAAAARPTILQRMEVRLQEGSKRRLMSEGVSRARSPAQLQRKQLLATWNGVRKGIARSFKMSSSWPVQDRRPAPSAAAPAPASRSTAIYTGATSEKAYATSNTLRR